MDEHHDIIPLVPDPTPVNPIPRTISQDDRVICVVCSYDLAGLPAEGVCPECGTEIERSRAGNQLVNASPAYLKSLHRGAVLILASIVVVLVAAIGGLIVGFAVAGGGAGWSGALPGPAATLFAVLFPGLGTLGGIVGLLGWWMFSAPDPGYVGRQDGSQARLVVRIAVLVRCVTTAGSFILTALAITMQPLFAVTAVVSVAEFLAWAVQYFASMLYIRWLALRVPNKKAYERAKLLMWLGPLLYTVGSCVVGLGPLLALVLYYNLFEWIRKDLKRIRAEQGHPA